ncbi:MAG: hypothetical protein ACTHML_20000 [Ginsengibacter sp.]
MSLEYIVEICVAIDIAILGIAYPIIVDKISNIGDKYSSQYISNLFDNEFPQLPLKFKLRKRIYQISTFKLTLYLTIITFLSLIINANPLFGWDNWFINNSAKLLVLTTTFLLTIFFFIWLDKVVLYNGKSTSLLTRIVSKYNILVGDTEIKSYHLKSINELTFYAIEKQDEHLQETLLEFYYREFSSIRKKHDKSKPLIYPVDLYFLVNRLNVELANNQNRKLLAIEHRAVSGIWLFGEDFEDIIISTETYNWVWRNLYTICDKEKFIRMYWANVSQYFDLRLEYIHEDHDFEINEVKNKEQIKKRNQERNEFLEFHYALGGLLFYRKQYKSLKYIFQYTQSQPPRYPLLPNNMTEIFIWFEDFRNEFKSRRAPLDTKYYFPELDNLGNSQQITFWICSYLTLLFIRQYSLDTYYVYQNHTALPQLPDNVIELNNWLDSVNYFERCLQETLKNDVLISELRWTSLVESNKANFEKFVGDLKAAITEKIGQQKLNAPLSQEKIQKFKDSTNAIITASFKKYDDIFISINEDEKDKELKLSVSGLRTLMTKSAFTDDDIPHLNYDTIFAEQVARYNIEMFIPNSFLVASTKRYLLNTDNILFGIEKIIANNKDAIIVAINISYEYNQVLGTSKYASLIKQIPATDMRDVIFILSKSDLPSIEHKDLKESEIKEYKLEALNEKIKTFASVIDINTPENNDIKGKWNSEDDSLELKVQLTITFLAVIFWKKEREIIQINLASRFREQGVQSDINEIEPLSDDKEKASS